jgi:hypothetical protein
MNNAFYSEDNTTYGPYTLPEVTVEPAGELTMPDLSQQGRVQSVMSPLEMVLFGSGNIVGRSATSIANYGIKQSNPYRQLMDNIKRIRGNERYKKLVRGIDEASKYLDSTFEVMSPMSLLERRYYQTKEGPGTEIIGADPNNPRYTSGKYADDYYIQDGKVFQKPEVELDWLFKELFTGSSENPRFLSRLSIIERAIQKAKKDK